MDSDAPELLTGLRALLQDTRRMSGRAFLDRVASGLSELLGGAYVQIGRLTADGRRIRAEPCAQQGNLLSPLEYDLENTPCAHVVGARTQYFPSGVAEKFPQDVFLLDSGFVSYLGCPMFDSTGAPSGLLSVLSSRPLSLTDAEITLFEALALRAGADMERSVAMEARAASEALFREIVDQQTEMVCRFSADGRVTFANRAYLETFGVAPEDLGTFAYEPKLHPADREHVRLALSRISRESPRVVIENRIFAADGRTLWTQWTNIGLYDDSGKLVGYQSAGRDVTAAKLAEERLREAHEQKDRFLAILAHELRNPLGAMLNALAVLELRAKEGRPDLRAIEIAKRQARQQSRLLDDLLDLSRITRGKVELRKVPLPLFQVVAEVTEARRVAFDGKSQALELDVPGEEVLVNADRVRLEQIIANLLDNASKYTPEHGRVRVEGEAGGGIAAIRVVDTGQGISPQMQAKVFDMFQQDLQNGAVGSGLGIGLTIVRELVERHGGSVSVHSPGPGQGSTFTVRLPTIAGARPSASAPSAVEAGEPRRRILVVDDNADSANMLVDLLRAWGHDANAVYDGEAAIRQAAAAPPELVLMDIAMPGLDGYATARQLRAAYPRSKMTLVALTGFGQPSDIRKARDADFDHHLTKPADEAALRDIIRDCG